MSTERVAQNFVKRYGRERLKRLIALLNSGESGQAIAEEFDVSRERVRQWKNTFGSVLTLYQVHPEVVRVLEDKRRDAFS
jgi:transposase